MRVEHWIYKLPLRVRSLFHRAQVEQELNEELRFHFEQRVQQEIERGKTPEEARHAARRALGNLTLVKEQTRETWGWTLLERIWQELRYAVRVLRKSPGFAATAILTLAVGIGASTAVFTLVDSVLLKPLTYRNSGQLVALWERPRFLGPGGPNPHHFDLWRKSATAFTGLTLLQHSASGLEFAAGRPRLINTVRALPNLFDVLETQPLFGRLFRAEDGVQGRNHVAILTYPVWRTLFHGDPNVSGRSIRLDNVPFEVIGVLPVGFHFPNANTLRAFPAKQAAGAVPEPEIFYPAVLDLSQYDWDGEYGNWVAFGRLKPGVSIKEAQAQLDAIESQILRLPAYHGSRRPGALAASVQPLQEAVVGTASTGLWLLMAAVFGLMLIACLNLANAQLGHAVSRYREVAVRRALGAPRWRLLWNSLAESLLLAVVGGAAGVLFSEEALRLFRGHSSIDLPRLSEVHLDTTVLLFSMALTFGASLLFGLLPAFRLLREDPQAALQQNNSRTFGSRQSRPLRTWLIGLQVFGCTVLLLLSALFLKSLLHLLHEDKGFDTGHVVLAQVRLPGKTYSADQSRTAFIDAVLNRLRSIPGVQSAGLVSAMPLEGESWVDGFRRPERPSQETMVNLRWASPGYFEAMRETLVAGRFFEERDRNRRSAILSVSLAKTLWPSGNPLGEQVETGGGGKYTVIGIVADSHNTSLKTPPPKMAYLDYPDRPPYNPVFTVRGIQRAGDLLSSVRQAIWAYAPQTIIAKIKTLDSQLDDSVAVELFQTSVLMAFAGAALFLAMLGIYGVLSYLVAARTQEIGVRMALGATRGKIYALTLSEAAKPVFAGLVAGLGVGILSVRLIRKLLYATQALDPSVILVVLALFIAAAALAAFAPARRAASIDPMQALRCE